MFMDSVLLLIVAILGVVATAFLGVLLDWLLKKILPVDPKLSHIIAGVIAIIVSVLCAVSPVLLEMVNSTRLPTPGASANSNIDLCYGKCWQYDQSNRTMTWVGPLDGAEDIWQGDEASLSRIRSGWITIIGPLDVPGEIEACVLTLNGQTVASSCNGEQHLYQVPADNLYQITSESLDFGGFRWKPALGYGYRLP